LAEISNVEDEDEGKRSAPLVNARRLFTKGFVMLRQLSKISLGLASVLAIAASTVVQAQQITTIRPAATSQAEATLEKAGSDGKYTFLVFYKTNDAATQSVIATLKEGLATRSEKAVEAFVQVGQPMEKTLVDRFDVSRAPMPMIIAVAPNGAITGMFAQKLSAELIEKSLQEGKLVFVCVQGSAKAPAPTSLKDFQADPHFKDRLAAYSMVAADAEETKFLKQMQIDPATAKGTTTVLLAPPGVLVGKFNEFATKDDIAAAIAKAGKCCEDPNCKHHQHQPAPRTTTPPSRGVRR
jgi:hypothetical protein